MELQELISRGRFIFAGAPKRLEVFKLINGRRSSKDIAIKTCRPLSALLHDIKKIRDMGLIRPKTDKNGNVVKKDGCIVYEKIPEIRHIPISYFYEASRKMGKAYLQSIEKRSKKPKLKPLTVPLAKEILRICEHGEDQLYEFKSPGIEIDKITREIVAFLHTKNGGLIFYGIDDYGNIVGSDLRRQDFDQSLQNSIRNTISPQPNIEIKERTVLGHKILIIVIPPWDRKTIYQYRDGRVYIRKGTNVFIVTSEELTKLGKGEYVI